MPDANSDAVPVMTPVEAAEGTLDVAGAITEPVIPATTDSDVVDTPDPETDIWEGQHPSQRERKTDLAPKEDPTRFQYQQSRADRAEAALKAAQLEVQRLASIQQQTVQPQVAPVQQAPAKDTLPEVVKPVRPTKPANFDPVEAVTTPTSESAKYQFAMQDYTWQLADYAEKTQAIKDQKEAQAVQFAQAQASERAKLAELSTTLKSKYGFNDSMVKDFVQTVTGDEAMTLDNLVLFWKGVRGAKQGAVKAGKMTSIQQRQREILPLNQLGGAAAETISEEDEFNLGLLRHRRK